MDIPDLKKLIKRHFPLVILAIIMLTSFSIRMYMTWSWDRDPVTMTSLIEDDSFYSLNIARNIASGRGVSFSEGIPTNGFQPFYVFIMVPVYSLFGNDIYTPIHIALTILTIFSVMTCAVIFHIVKRIINNDIAAIFAACIWAFNPCVFYNSLGGLEGAVEVFFVSLIILYYLKIRNKTEISSYIGLGFLFGLAIFARTSTIILLGAILLDILLNVRADKSAKSFYKIYFKLSRAGIVICFALLILAPWLIWNLITFGTIAQSSGQASYLQFHHSEVSLGEYIGISIDNILLWSLILVNCFLGIMSKGPYPVLELIFITGLIMLSIFFLIICYFKNKYIFNRILYYGKKVFSNSWFYILFSVIIFLFYTVYLWRVSWRYFLDIILLGVIFIGVLFGFVLNKYDQIYSETVTRFKMKIKMIFKRGMDENESNRISENPKSITSHKRGKKVFVFLIFMVIIVGYNGKIFLDWRQSTTSTVNTSDRIDLFRITEYINNNIEPEAKIGTFNAGIVGYFSNRTVINLDGLVNNKAYNALDRNRLYRYILDENISYLVDHHDVVIYFLNQFSMDFDEENDIALEYLMNATNPQEDDMAVFRVIP
jgi:hypothetical protein